MPSTRLMSLLATLLCLQTLSPAAPRVSLNGGLFFEAEDYDQLLRGEFGFAAKTAEPLASGDTVLIGMWKPGAISYRLSAAAEGDYHLWLRYAAPGEVVVKFGVNAPGEADLQEGKLPATLANLTAPGAYKWGKLGEVELPAGEFTFILGQGAQRPDCFFLTPSADFTPGADFLREVQRAHEAPKGKLLPELSHERRITQHPQWLKHALRPAYAHFEWDRDKATPDEWGRKVKEAGGNCLFGVGEMPAGMLAGKMRALPFSLLNQAEVKLPEGYAWDYSWTKEFVAGGHRHGLQVVLYDGAHRTLDPILLEHPEWRQMEANGKPYAHGFGSWHSPYRQAWIDRWVQVARLSGMDGLMIDMMFTGPRGGDFSDFTVQAFKDKFGVEPPREPDPRHLIWQRWVDFQNWTREEALLDLTEALHAVNPEIAVIVNQTEGWIFGNTDTGFLSPRAGQCCDGLLEEMGWEFRHNWNRPWAWPLHAQWQNLFLHCRTRPGYGQMWDITHHFPLAHLESLCYAMFANGAAPGAVTGGNFPEMAQVWKHIAACEASLVDADTVPWLALHFGRDTLDWFVNARGDDVREAWLKNVFGVFQMALEMHLPVDIITDDDLGDLAILQRYAVVMLPDSACLSERQARALDQYVRQGGGLVATSESGCFDENGTRLEAPRLQALLGATQLPAVTAKGWSLPLADLSHPVVDHPEIKGSGAWNQGQSNPAASGALYSGSRLIAATPVTDLAPGVFSAPLLGGPRPEPQDGKPPLYRTVLCREVDQGKVAFFPLDLGHAYYVWNQPLNRRLMERAVTWAAGRPCPLQTDGPMILQTVLWRQGDTRVVHLLNDISSFGRAAAPSPEAYAAFRAEVIPLHDVTVSVRGAYRRARLLPADTDLPVKSEGGLSTVTVPRLEIHALVVFSP